MTDGSITGRDRVWSVALEVGRAFRARGYLREFSPETVVDLVDDRGLDVSSRTVRRVLDAMVATGALEDVSDGELRLYRLPTAKRACETEDVAKSVNGLELEPVDRYDDEATSSLEDLTAPLSPLASDEPLIVHLFADWGVESEPLSAYGRVVRIGLDPSENGFSDAIRADALEPPLRDVFDLAVCHPPCQRWSTLTPASGDPEDHPDHIDETREIARELAEDYVIENVPQAPLRDPVVLSGRMFRLPGSPFRRAFETSFHVDQPDEVMGIEDPDSPFADKDGELGSWSGSKRLWRTIKQVSAEYPSKALKNNGIPAPYIHFLAYWWLRSRPELIDTPWSSDMTTSSRDTKRACANGGARHE